MFRSLINLLDLLHLIYKKQLENKPQHPGQFYFAERNNMDIGEHQRNARPKGKN